MKKIKVFILSIILLIIILLGSILIKTKAAEQDEINIPDIIEIGYSTSESIIINFDTPTLTTYINNNIFEKGYFTGDDMFNIRLYFDVYDPETVSNFNISANIRFYVNDKGGYNIDDIWWWDEYSDNTPNGYIFSTVKTDYNDNDTWGYMILSQLEARPPDEVINISLMNIIVDTMGLIEPFTINEFIIDCESYNINQLTQQLINTQKELEDTQEQLWDLQNQVDHWEFDKQLMQEHIAQLEADKTALEAQVLELTKSLEIRYKEGYLNGYNYAYEKAKEEAQKDIDKAYQDGKVVGYNEGVNVALENTPALKWVGAFIAASTAILDVKVGSVSIGTLVMIPLSISIVAFIIKMWKGGQEG